MFNSKASIKFMMAKIFFTLANFGYRTISEVTPSVYHGTKTIEINYVRNGYGKVIIDNNEYQVKGGSYIVIPEFVSYSIIPTEPIDLYSIYLLIDDKTGYKEYLPLLKKYFVGNDNSLLVMDFDDLYNELRTLKFGYNEIVVSDFKKIIVKLLRNEKIQGERLSHWEADSLQFEIENIITTEFKTITLNDLAERLHLSVRELQRYLSKNYKKSFNELKTEAKMNFASNKILYSNAKLTELYDQVGYTSPEHLSYAFKKYYGMSPLEYKRKYKKVDIDDD